MNGSGQVVGNAAERSVFAANGRYAFRVVNAFGYAASIDRVFVFGIIAYPICDTSSIDQGDLALAVGRGIDAVDNQRVIAVIGNIDICISIRCFYLAVAGAQNLSGKNYSATLRHDVFHDNRLLLRVKIGVYRHAVSAEADAGYRVTIVIDQRTAQAWYEAAADMERDGLHTTLNEAVYVQEARCNRDLALGQNP